MRNIKSIFIGLLLAITLLLTIAIGVSLIYEDEVSQYLVEELNHYLLSEIKAEDVKFSLVKKFPKATLEFKNVVAYSKKGYYKNIKGFNTDTLFYAKRIFIQLNLIDILSKKYNINSIHFDQGVVNLFIDHLGDPNYIFWDSTEKESSKDFNLELTEVKITNTELLFCNDATNLVLKSYLKKVDFTGNFSSQNYFMKIKSDQLVRELDVDDVNYLNRQKLKAEFNLDIINNRISLKQGNLNLENLSFMVNGNLDLYEKQKIDLLISGKDLNLRSFLINLPISVKNQFPSIIGQKGEVTLNLNISGENLRTETPHVNALFIVNNAQIFDENRQIRLENIFIDGEFSNGENNSGSSSKIVFKSFQTDLEQNHFEGKLELNNFKDPSIKVDLKSELFLDEIKDLFELDTFDVLKGHVLAQVNYNGTYSEIRAFKFPDLFTQDYIITVKLEKGELKFKENPITVSEISGKFDLRKTLLADSLYFKIKENDFLIKGRVSKLFEYFTDHDIFNVNAQVFSRKINLDELAPLFKNKDDRAEMDPSYHFPDKLSLQLRLNIQNFEVGKFNATNVVGNLNYKPRMFSLHEISFNSMNGKVKAGGVIIQKFNNDFVVKSQSRLSNININKLFYSFNDFGQTFITNKNLEGNLSGDVYFDSEWSEKLLMYKNTANAECDIVINDGQLNNFEPMMSLSRFIDVDELKSIKFSTLKNKITIQNQQVIIPQMDIVSSALDVTASGEHNFDNTYSYHFKLLLSDLLSGKMKKSKHKDQNPENIEEDKQGRVTLYLLIEGNENKSKVKYDRKAARDVRKENMKSERSELKQILNEEFGWFKKDSAIKDESNKEESNDQFQIEFEESKSQQTKQEKIKSDQKFKIEWEEDSTSKK